MAICLIKSSVDFGEQFILTPERYNPNRRMTTTSDDGIVLSELVMMTNETITTKQAAKNQYYQINTSDAMGGCLRISTEKGKLQSNKKILHTGEIIISRLRPYLKQVAFVDVNTKDELICASTELYVLRSLSKESIAYLVPFLLSDAAQKVFANAVEGSQHPRFKEDDLLNLVVPHSIFDSRGAISQNVLDAIKHFRFYEQGLANEIKRTNLIIQ